MLIHKSSFKVVKVIPYLLDAFLGVGSLSTLCIYQEERACVDVVDFLEVDLSILFVTVGTRTCAIHCVHFTTDTSSLSASFVGEEATLSIKVVLAVHHLILTDHLVDETLSVNLRLLVVLDQWFLVVLLIGVADGHVIIKDVL